MDTDDLDLKFTVEPIYSSKEADNIRDALYKARSNHNEEIKIYGNIFMKYIPYLNLTSGWKFRYVKIFSNEVLVRQLTQLKQLIAKYVKNSKLNTIKIDFVEFQSDILLLKLNQKKDRRYMLGLFTDLSEYYYGEDLVKLYYSSPSKQFLIYYNRYIRPERDQNIVFSLMKYLIKLDIEIELTVEQRFFRLEGLKSVRNLYLFEYHLLKISEKDDSDEKVVTH
jgi:hypothetical protein